MYHQNHRGFLSTIFWDFVFGFFLAPFYFSAKFLFLHLYCNCPPRFWFLSRQFLSLWHLTGQCWDFPRAKLLWPFPMIVLWAFQLNSHWLWQQALSMEAALSACCTFWGHHALVLPDTPLLRSARSATNADLRWVSWSLVVGPQPTVFWSF